MILTIKPNNKGTYATLKQFPLGGENWEHVCDHNDGTFVYNDVIGPVVDDPKSDKPIVDLDTYNFEDVIRGQEGTVNNINVFAVCWKQSKGEQYLQTGRGCFYLITNGYEHLGPCFPIGDTPEYYHTNFPINPITLEPWTIDEVNALEVGVKITPLSTDTVVFCSEMWIEVDYRPSLKTVSFDRVE